MTPEMITKLTETILTVIVIITSYYVIPYLRAKIGIDKMENFRQFCQDAVRAAEQIYTPDEWKLKKDYVESMVTVKANQWGLELDEAEIDAIIEGVVNYVKHNKNGNAS